MRKRLFVKVTLRCMVWKVVRKFGKLFDLFSLYGCVVNLDRWLPAFCKGHAKNWPNVSDGWTALVVIPLLFERAHIGRVADARGTRCGG